MKWIFCVALAGVLISPTVLAVDPVILSEPVPPIPQAYLTGTPQTVVYTVTNRVPKHLPITLSGISGPLTRVPVANDCGHTLPVGPATCKIGIQITLDTLGTSVNQLLKINYDGRSPLTSPIAFSIVAPFAYVTPGPNANTIYQFSLDRTDGTFSSDPITTYSSGSKHFDQLTFATVGGVQYAYVLDQNGFVYQCDINETDGTFSRCTPTPESSPGWGPHGIAFATVHGVQYAYISSVNGRVYQCSLNVGGDANGSFENCSALDFYFRAPYGITFATVDGVQYAYIAEAVSFDSSYGNVYRCTLKKDGSFNTCSTTPQECIPDWIPYTVTFATVDGTQYAYVTDNGTNTSNGHVYQCTLTEDGFFDTCTATIGAPTTNWVPDAIAFATLNGTQYAYVGAYQGVSAGGMYQCTLNSGGLFSACNAQPSSPYSPPSPWQPVGVAFRFD